MILLGHIVGAHGIRGEVIIRSYAARPEDIAAYGPLADETGRRTFTIASARATAKGVVARLESVTDRNAAEALKGVALYVAREKLPAPADGEFYHADLIGLTAVGLDGSRFGEIVAVANYGASDLIEVRLDVDGQTEFIPFDDVCVPTLDIAARRAVVVRPLMVEHDADTE